MKTFASVILLSLAMSAGTAFAQSPPPAKPAPAAQPAGMMDKKAVSKACTDQANAKGLHGKERKKFRSACKHSGGKM